MKYIVYKRFKHTLLYPETKHELPGEYIIEYHDISLFPKDYFKTNNGWEVEPEDNFNLELKKNQDIINTFNEQKRNLDTENKNLLKQKLSEELHASKEEYKDYLAFKSWQKEMKMQGFLKHINIHTGF